MSPRVRRILVLSVTGVYWVALFVATHLPTSRLPRTRVSDDVIHFFAYAVLAVLLLASLRQIGVPLRAAAWWVIAIGFTYAAVDEILQIPVGRICSLKDWVADAIGVTTVAALAIVIGAWWEVREG